jgi:hypothetical protein
MSEFTGECGHTCLPSDGYCEKCDKLVKIIRIDGKTNAQLEYCEYLNEQDEDE